MIIVYLTTDTAGKRPCDPWIFLAPALADVPAGGRILGRTRLTERGRLKAKWVNPEAKRLFQRTRAADPNAGRVLPEPTDEQVTTLNVNPQPTRHAT